MYTKIYRASPDVCTATLKKKKISKFKSFLKWKLWEKNLREKKPKKVIYCYLSACNLLFPKR